MTPGLIELAPVLQKRVQSELKAGETVVWVGRPLPGGITRLGFLAWIFFVPWTAFSLFWMAGAAGFAMPQLSLSWNLLFPLFGLPFVLVGLAGMATPFWLRLMARHTVYVITNQRAFTLHGLRTWTVRTYPPEKLGNPIRRERADGSGDLVFGKDSYTDSDGDPRQRMHGFMAVADVREVERRVQHLVSFEGGSPFA